jgi:probable addiction module antidote protein
MATKSKSPVKTTPFDAAEYLTSDAACASFLEAAFESGDAAHVARAVGVVARARGMSQLARDTGLTREALYRALSKDGNPELGTVLKVVSALGLKLVPQVA